MKLFSETGMSCLFVNLSLINLARSVFKVDQGRDQRRAKLFEHR